MREAHRFLKVLLVCAALTASNAIDENSTYWQERQFLLAKEQTTILGQGQILTSDEQEVNDLLMKFKNEELEAAFSSLDFPPSKNFLNVKPQIEASNIFKFVKQMPKGAALHLHDTAMATVTWVISEITYWDHLYMCYIDFNGNQQMLTKFMETPDTSCEWQLMSEVRASYPSAEEFDIELQQRFSIVLANPEVDFPDIDAVWAAFESTLIAITGMLMYRQAWETYLYRSLQEFMEDNVLHLEFRGTLPRLYELDGTELTEVESMAVYEATSQKFLNDNINNYFGTRYIYAPLRRVDNATVWNYVTLAKELKKEYPKFVAGFDLVGQEDLGLPLKEFLDQLLSLSSGDVKVPVFYHAGETAWYGVGTDENLIDALLLNSTRIGHGYAITKHPEAKDMSLSKDVPLEICPISNQVLMLIADLRNHPASGLIAEGFPIVVSADDPGTWGSVGLSYDFYEAFMAFGGTKADLRFLKQLAINSIKYSSTDEDEKMMLMSMWQEKWDEFIATMKRTMNKYGKFVSPVFSSMAVTDMTTAESGITVSV